jgi:hypothetical protein
VSAVKPIGRKTDDGGSRLCYSARVELRPLCVKPTAIAERVQDLAE